MQYIILDMEWNQPWPGSYSAKKALPSPLRGEIVQIGAVRMTQDQQVADEFQILIRPKYFKKMNRKIASLTGIRDSVLREKGVRLEENPAFHERRRAACFASLSAEEKNALIQKDARYGRVICRCETITEGEILAALHSEVPATTIDGVKRRCNAGMGRCQGGFCGPRVLELISRTRGIDPLDVLQDKAGSNVLLCETKQEGEHHD